MADKKKAAKRRPQDDIARLKARLALLETDSMKLREDYMQLLHDVHELAESQLQGNERTSRLLDIVAELQSYKASPKKAQDTGVSEVG